MLGIHCTAQLHALRWLMIVAMTACLAPAISAAAEPAQRAVLIIDEADPGKGGPTTFSATLRATLDDFAPHVAVYGDSLDLSRFAGSRQEEILRRFNPVHLQQVLLNLVLNGMDASAGRSPNDRRVTIRTSVVNNATLKVSIADSGSGISADKLQQIFEPFFTTKEMGTGLGLAIARTIIERSGGEISAENRPNGGAVFRFSLPLVEELVA